MIKVQYKRLSQLEREDSERLYFAELICDDVNELPKPEHYKSWTIDMGSIAHVINTGDTYRLNSSGDWKLQKKTESGGVMFTESDKAKLDSLTNPILLKDRVNSREELDKIPNPKTGWLYFVGEDDADAFEEYVYTEAGKWEFIGYNNVDLSNYVQKTDLASYVATGCVKIQPVAYSRSIDITPDGIIYVTKATNQQINDENAPYKMLSTDAIPIFMSNYGITKDTIQKILDRLTALENGGAK